MKKPRERSGGRKDSSDWFGHLVANALGKLDTLLTSDRSSLLRADIYARFLRLLEHPSNKLVLEAMKVFVSSFTAGKDDPHSFAALCKSFCASLRIRMYALPLWEPFSQIEMPEGGVADALTECIEKWVCNELYTVLFSALEEDIARDHALFERLSALVFITPQHLEIPKKYWTARSSLMQAAEHLFAITKRRSPLEKLEVIQLTCNVIVDALNRTDPSGASADVFLPVLVYVLIQSNPPQLYSHIAFIRNFRNKTFKGTQLEYYLVSLETAMGFVENIQSRDLAGVSEEELQELMRKSLAGEIRKAQPFVQAHEDWIVMNNNNNNNNANNANNSNNVASDAPALDEAANNSNNDSTISNEASVSVSVDTNSKRVEPLLTSSASPVVLGAPTSGPPNFSPTTPEEPPSSFAVICAPSIDVSVFVAKLREELFGQKCLIFNCLIHDKFASAIPEILFASKAASVFVILVCDKKLIEMRGCMEVHVELPEDVGLVVQILRSLQ